MRLNLFTLIKSGKRHLAKSFCFIYRYIDDVLSINNPKFGNYIDDIYPAELEIKNTTDADHRVSYLNLDLSYDRDKRLQVKLYDKRFRRKFHEIAIVLNLRHFNKQMINVLSTINLQLHNELLKDKKIS